MFIKLSTGDVIEAKKDESLLEALKKKKIFLIASCGGKGLCGKCKVKIIEGDYKIKSKAKLPKSDLESGYTIACQTFPLSDLIIEIPKESKLAVGDKIAISKSDDLLNLLKLYNTEITPIVKNLELKIPPPTLNDNISDLERLKREIERTGLIGMRFPYPLIQNLANILRSANWEVIVGYTLGRDIVYVKPKTPQQNRYGIAIDIGTTTIVVYLININNGQIIDIGSTYNSQIKYGDDIITRIIYATEENGLDALREAVISDINGIIMYFKDIHNLSFNEIESAVISGNTTMTHIFWGLNPAYIREEPYIPTVNYFPRWRGEYSRLYINPLSPIYTMPCVASYVGGDIVSGVLASGLYRNKEISLFMDIGTNGEIAIGNNEWLITAACSAGPCFEGSGITHGMRATTGAIESVTIDPITFEPTFTTNGNTEPLGICGSGMIDVISEMFLTGIIDQKGKFTNPQYIKRVRKGENGYEYIIYEKQDRSIVLTEVDIENILRAKAAIYAGISLLIKEVGLDLDIIEKIYIAGGFGNYLNIEKAIILGMLPDIPRERFIFIGNASITGAYLCLLSRDLRRLAGEIASKMTYVELSVSRRFMDEYMSALFLPHTNIDLFPSVKEKIQKNG